MTSTAVQDQVDDVESFFDPAVCAALYNRIIHIGFEGSQCGQRGDRLAKNWFHAWRNDPHVHKCRETFPEILTSFLEQIEVIIDQDGHPKHHAFVQHLQVVSSPTRTLALGPGSSWMEIDDCILLFRNNLYCLTDCPGVLMDLSDLMVCYLPSIYDFNPDNPEASSWYPLRVLLERLNAIIEVGKYRPVPYGSAQDGYKPLSPDILCWEVVPWTDPFLKQTLDAYNALVEAITARLPFPTEDQRPPLATDEFLSAEVKGFPRAFLLSASKPSFQFIAPGLTIYDVNQPPPLPRADSTTNDYDAPSMHYTEAFHDPLILFPAVGYIKEGAGLWICPDEGWADTARLVLPYVLSSYPDHTGEQVTRPSATQLWQQGECPFYVDHSTRLGTMLNQWRVLVEEGMWTVGANGVEGGVEFYRQAEDVDKAGWFCLMDDCFDLSEIAFRY
ncbi:hypothetical protein P170DRAFT_411542 [Aspergillus steynii IBT 23096]|uniref:Uncharacterized protein n=1 Tax=Aspergillus steynii IBT 23096 TaxID=1392250 RepID=A0A2I2G0H7_9EURO|nr:uncharacterized protein P170DRAFT_411542 [Aspergillus steynii IBT 23096]PLB46336.1 hypothetical protein P170DRAFT_411542 [Aspergillus steynii IBT 23096]